MGYREDYSKAVDFIVEGKPIWIPSTKVVFIPPNFLVWLGADRPKLCRMEPYSTRNLARYIVTQKIKNDVSLCLATPDEINTYRDDLIVGSGEIIKKLPEPYQTRFSATMLVVS